MIDRLNSGAAVALTQGARVTARVVADRPALASVRGVARSPVDAGPPPLDTARVTALREAIASGSYRVDAHAIAARMIASDLAGS